MPDEPTPAPEAAPAAEPIVTEAQPESGYKGDLTEEFMQNTLNEAFNQLPGADTFLRGEADKAAAEELKKPAEEKPAEPAAEPKAEEPKVEEEKAPEPAADDIVDPNDPEEKRQSTWNRLKKEAKEAVALREQLKEFEGTKAEREQLKIELEKFQKETEAIKAEQEQMHAELFRGRIQAHPLFRERVIEPFNTLQEASKAIAEENELDPEELFQVIVKGDKKAMYEMTNGLHSYDQTQIFDMFKDMRHIVAARDNLFADSKKAAEAFAQQEEEAGKKYYSDLTERRNRTSDLLTPKLEERVYSLIPEEKRKDLKALRAEVADFDNWADEVKVYSGYSSVLLPPVIETLEATQAELKAAKAEIAKLRGGSPKVVSKGQPATPATKQTEDKTDYSKMSTDSLAEEAVKRIRESMGIVS